MVYTIFHSNPSRESEVTGAEQSDRYTEQRLLQKDRIEMFSIAKRASPCMLRPLEVPLKRALEAAPASR